MARLDTHWHAHSKVLALGLDGMGLHAWGISYCDAELTDGFIPFGALPGLLPRVKQAVNRLVELGRWEVVEGGYRVHNYLRYNRSRQQVLTERAEAKQRMNKARSSPDVQANNGRSSGEVQPLPVPVPVPVPKDRVVVVVGNPEAGARGGDKELPLEVLERLSRPPITTTTTTTTTNASQNGRTTGADH